MRRTFRIGLAAGLLAAPGLHGCGGERTERGLAPAEEVAVPESERDLGMTEAERQAEIVDEDEAAEDERFDEAERPAEQ